MESKWPTSYDRIEEIFAEHAVFRAGEHTLTESEFRSAVEEILAEERKDKCKHCGGSLRECRKGHIHCNSCGAQPESGGSK